MGPMQREVTELEAINIQAARARTQKDFKKREQSGVLNVSNGIHKATKMKQESSYSCKKYKRKSLPNPFDRRFE